MGGGRHGDSRNNSGSGRSGVSEGHRLEHTSGTPPIDTLLGGTTPKPKERDQDNATLPSTALRFSTLADAGYKAQVIIGDLAEAQTITHREYNAFQSQLPLFKSITELALYADALKKTLHERGANVGALDEFVKNHLSLQGMRLTFRDFVANLKSPAIVERRTYIKLQFDADACGEYKSNHAYVFCGMHAVLDEPVLVHVNGRNGEARAHLGQKPISGRDIIAVEVLGPIKPELHSRIDDLFGD